MIKMKQLLWEGLSGSMSLSPKDLYNFYYLWSIMRWEPRLIQTQYGRDIANRYIKGFKDKYLTVFKDLVYNQLKKYVQRGRIDKDFPIARLTPGADAVTLRELMRKTWRTDMIRRNDSTAGDEKNPKFKKDDQWGQITHYMVQLERANTQEEICLNVNQLNNCVHNTKTSVLDKINYDLVSALQTIGRTIPLDALVAAYDRIHNFNNIHGFDAYVDRDLRELFSQGEGEAPEEISESLIKNFHPIPKSS